MMSLKDHCDKHKCCNKRFHAFPFLLIALGVIFLLGNLGVIPGLGTYWPVLLIILGLVKIGNELWPKS